MVPLRFNVSIRQITDRILHQRQKGYIMGKVTVHNIKIHHLKKETPGGGVLRAVKEVTKIIWVLKHIFRK